MRRLLAAASLASFAAWSPIAAGQPVASGHVAQASGCADFAALEQCGIVYALHLDGAGYADWTFELFNTSGVRIGFQPGDLTGSQWRVDTAQFTRPVDGDDVLWVMTFFGHDEVSFESLPLATSIDGGLQRAQLVGDSPPLPASIGFTIVTPSTQVDLGNGPVMFPMGSSGGITVAFAPLADLAAGPAGSCDVGGESPDPATGRGIVRGYNVYRLAGLAFDPPEPHEIFRPETWQYFIDLDTFNLDVPDTQPGFPGFPSPQDLDQNDLAGIANADGLPYTGDELIFFSDSAYGPTGLPRRSGQPPDLFGGTFYWYGIQAVARGNVSDFAAVSLAGGPSSDYRLDLDADGFFDAVDVDGDGAPEFFSPQAEMGHPGLGFRISQCGPGCPPLRLRCMGGTSNPAPAVGGVSVAATVVRSALVLTVSTGIETAGLVGFDVFRLDGEEPLRVNDHVILARGGEGNVYEVVDPRALRRAAWRGGISYLVEAVLEDGTREPHGPFTVEVARGARRAAN